MTGFTKEEKMTKKLSIKKEKPAIGLGGFIAGSKKDGVFSLPFFSLYLKFKLMSIKKIKKEKGTYKTICALKKGG